MLPVNPVGMNGELCLLTRYGLRQIVRPDPIDMRELVGVLRLGAG